MSFYTIIEKDKALIVASYEDKQVSISLGQNLIRLTFKQVEAVHSAMMAEVISKDIDYINKHNGRKSVSDKS